MNGGVARSNTVMQVLADVCELHVERTESVEMSVLGAAMLAKLGLELDGAQLSEAQLRERIDSVALLARRVRGDLTLFHPRTLTPAAHSHAAARRTDTGLGLELRLRLAPAGLVQLRLLLKQKRLPKLNRVRS